MNEVNKVLLSVMLLVGMVQLLHFFGILEVLPPTKYR